MQGRKRDTVLRNLATSGDLAELKAQSLTVEVMLIACEF